MKNTYKVWISRTENYWGQTVSNNFELVDFDKACELKNIKPKIGQFKRTYKPIQKDRISTNYPASSELAWFFKLPQMPDIEADNQPSSWDATIFYIEKMYGKKYAESFMPAAFNDLRKAA